MQRPDMQPGAQPLHGLREDGGGEPRLGPEHGAARVVAGAEYVGFEFLRAECVEDELLIPPVSSITVSCMLPSP